MRCFNLLVLVLCLQIISVKSCTWLVEQLSKELEDNKIDEASKSIAVLSIWPDCEGAVLENASNSAKSKGYGARFFNAVNKAIYEGWGNVDVLWQIGGFVSNAGFAVESPPKNYGIDHSKAGINPPEMIGSWTSGPSIPGVVLFDANVTEADSVKGNDQQNLISDDPTKTN